MSERKRMLTMDEIEEAALQLPEREREVLLDRVAASLPVEAAAALGFRAELKRRVDAVRAGTAELVDAEEVLAELEAEP